MNTKGLDYINLKKKYLVFLKKNETKKKPIVDKLGKLNNFYLPLSEWIYSVYEKDKKIKIIGLSGGQGAGKSTITAILKFILKLKYNLDLCVFSIDDFYKTQVERVSMSKKVHPLFLTRGVPGTHDINMMLNFFKKSKIKKFKRLKLPTFNKAIDDRFNKKKWYDLKNKPDVIIFEGWCVGAKSENSITLKRTINSMEKLKDQRQIWRKYVNQQLKTKYKNLYSQLNCLIYLKAKNFSLLQKWRLKQERKLWLKSKKNSKLKIMNRGDVINFMQTYQRITQNMFKNMPKYASIIFNLNNNHQIKSAIYKNK